MVASSAVRISVSRARTALRLCSAACAPVDPAVEGRRTVRWPGICHLREFGIKATLGYFGRIWRRAIDTILAEADKSGA
jgi:hypothetical protein